MERGKKSRQSLLGGLLSKDVNASIIGSAVFLASFLLDGHIFSFFKNASIVLYDSLLALLTDFKFVILVMLLVPTFFYFRSHRKFPKILWASFICSAVVSYIIKVLVARPRPIMADSFDVFSFPSTHAMAVFSALPFISKNTGFPKVFILYAVIVTFSRVYFSYHYLSDVVFGAFFGYFIGNTVQRFLTNGQRI